MFLGGNDDGGILPDLKKKKDYLDLHVGHEQNLTAKTSVSIAISGEDDEGFSHCSRPV